MEVVEKFASGAAAVLVIDLQNDFCHPDGVMADRGFDVTGLPEIAQRVNRFVASARVHRVPVVWVRTTHDELTNSQVWLARYGTTMKAADPPPTNCRPGTWGAEFWEVEPEHGEPVVLKHRYSAFAGTSLDWVLRALERRSLLIAGVATDACVESTLRDAFFHDYHVNLVADCCASYSAERHDASVSSVRRLFGLVPTSDDVIAQWEYEAAVAG